MPIETMPSADEVVADVAAADGLATPASPSDADLVADELLVEEISIDGMCGVY